MSEQVQKEKSTLVTKVRDFSYDTVFHIGDSGLQFTADLIRGPDNGRSSNYVSRQLHMRERKHREKSLNFDDRAIFKKLMERKKTENQVQHWKRMNALLALEDKQSLVVQFRNVETQKKKLVSRASTLSTRAEMVKLERQFQQIHSAKFASKNTQKL